MNQEKKSNIKPYLRKLFLLVAFPIHIWSIFQIFENLNWVAERTVFADAIGYGAYALLAALIESGIFFLIALPIFFMLARLRTPEKALAITVLSYFTIALLWIFRSIMINQTGDPYFLDSYIHHLADQAGWRLRFRYLAFLLAAILLNIPVVLVPVLANRYDKTTTFLLTVAERVEILMYLILGLDALAIVLIIVRNILGAL